MSQSEKIRRIREALSRKFETELIAELRETQKEFNEYKKIDKRKNLLFDKLIDSIPKIADKIASECKVQEVMVNWDKMPIAIKKGDPVKVDWENQKQIIIPDKVIVSNQLSEKKITTPIKLAINSVEMLLTVIRKTITDGINRLVEMIREPNEIIIKSDQIIEYYGNRKVIYNLSYEGNKLSKIQRIEE